ncbi:hypothetical protein VPH35_001370 [Triticum aestivum]
MDFLLRSANQPTEPNHTRLLLLPVVFSTGLPSTRLEAAWTWYGSFTPTVVNHGFPSDRDVLECTDLSWKASKEHGYYIAVNGLKEISDGKIRELTGDVLFPVTFTCITQRPMKGDILVGSVEKILKHGVFLKSGPMENIFMPAKSMSDYKYMGGENPMFMKDYSKLEKHTIVRFKVMGFCWMEADRQFRLLATMAGDFLGPL